MYHRGIQLTRNAFIIMITTTATTSSDYYYYETTFVWSQFLIRRQMPLVVYIRN